MRWCLRRLALAAFLLSLITGLPLTAVRTLRRVGRATLSLGENARRARVRLLGAATVAALDSIRRAIPEDGEYLLVDGGEAPQAEAYWVRFELAPRRAVFLGRLSELERAPRLSWKLPPLGGSDPDSGRGGLRVAPPASRAAQRANLAISHHHPAGSEARADRRRGGDGGRLL